MANQHSRLDHLKSKGIEIVQHCLRDENTLDDDASRELDVTLADGLYEIRQMSQGDAEAATINGYNATMPVPVLMQSPDAVPPTSVSTCGSTVFYTGFTQLTLDQWWLTRQYLNCVENGYTIVPKEPGIPSGLTTVDIVRQFRITGKTN